MEWRIDQRRRIVPYSLRHSQKTSPLLAIELTTNRARVRCLADEREPIALGPVAWIEKSAPKPNQQRTRLRG